MSVPSGAKTQTSCRGVLDRFLSNKVCPTNYTSLLEICGKQCLDIYTCFSNLLSDKTMSLTFTPCDMVYEK